MRYIGVDLAWGRRNSSAAVALSPAAAGCAALEVLAYHHALQTDEDILAFIEKVDDGESLLVGIDAPLIVPNATGERPCERRFRRCFGRYHAGPLPANRRLLGDPVRGEELAKRLKQELGLLLDFHLPLPPMPARRCFEVFPHSAHVALFGLPRTLKYKAKPGRTLPSRLAEYERLVAHIASLAEGVPPLLTPAWLKTPTEKRGAALKQYEDLLDALLCAYIVAYYALHGLGERCRVVGDLQTGYILTPTTPAINACLDKEPL